MAEISNMDWFRVDAIASQIIALANAFPSPLRTELNKLPLPEEGGIESLDSEIQHVSEKTSAPYMLCRIYVVSELCKASVVDNSGVSERSARVESAKLRTLMSDESLMAPAWDYLTKCGAIVE